MITEAQKEKIKAMKEPVIYVHPDNLVNVCGCDIQIIVNKFMPLDKLVILDNAENPFRHAKD